VKNCEAEIGLRLFGQACLKWQPISADALGAKCVYWSPSGNLIESGYFKDAIQSFVDGGAFPALALVRFDSSKEWVTRSTGLDWFSGQEIDASHPQLSARDAMYRLVRIAHDMAMIGPYENESQLDGLNRRRTASR
jgi:hypothetical protein